MKNLQEYQKLCKKTAQKFNDKPAKSKAFRRARHNAERLWAREKEILTWGLGLVGEAGDVGGCIKKTFSHKNDQRTGIKENLGDTLWYAAMICNYFHWDLDEILKENIEKLKKRYPKGFAEKAAKRKGIDWNEK